MKAETKRKISDGVKRAYVEGRLSRDVGVKTRLTADRGRFYRLAQLEHEESQARQMREDGYEIYSPTVVCDRIAVKDGKVFFVEFKFDGQSLRPGQQKVRDSVPEMYLVVNAKRVSCA